MLTVSFALYLLSSATSHTEMSLLAVKILVTVLISNRYRPHKYQAFQFSTRVFLYQQKRPRRQKELQSAMEIAHMCIKTSALGTSNKTGHVKKGKPF